MSTTTSSISRRLTVAISVAITWVLFALQVAGPRVTAQSSNPIPAENQLPGNPRSEWDITGSGDSSIQGFATEISVNKGTPVSFKVTTPASTFSINIYRLGYYQGNGARKVATLSGIAGKSQAACLSDAATGLYDCGNWTVSATWNVPATAVSGIYIAKLIRGDNNGASHIPFVVRDDAAQADVLLQTSDTTWQAYNQFGGHSLYLGTPTRGYKVSYNRPFATRGQSTGYGTSNYLFYAEQPMVRWLESNGFNVKYWSGIDTDRFGSALSGAAKPKVFMTVGHDEYWSGSQRNAVEAARAAGVHMAFLTGNDNFWKTRWEPSIDGSSTPYRTLVTYKETHANAKLDPNAAWTGTWRDPRFSPPADAGRPENALSGQIFTVNRGTAAITVPGTYAGLRFWRNTAIAALAPNQSLTLAADTLGYEWDEDLDNGARPAGAIQMSSTTINVPERVQDMGSTYLPGPATHHLSLYRHASGALVFGAGTVQWVWGLDTIHDVDPDFGSTTPDPNMRQAMINLLADMGVQPATIQSALVPATASSDATPPTSTITSPVDGASIAAGTIVTVSGTAADGGGGIVGGVEVSTDGGQSWRRATGKTNWSYTWVPGVLGAASILSRATDDSGNLEQPTGATIVTITQATCPCSIWTPSLTVPWMVDSNDGAAVEVGLKFRADVGGIVNGVRFYKAPANTGTHTGHLWTSGGQLLGTVTFGGESASGWQQANFTSQIVIQANTTYVVSYFAPNGHYSDDQYALGRDGVDQWPLHALKSGVDGPNGVFFYGASGFPNATWFSDSYGVDVVFTPDLTAPAVALTAPAGGSNISGNAVTVSATASDNLGIAGVQFKIDGNNLNAEDTSSPYSISWNSNLTANGTHTLTAVARDTAGNLTTSAPIVVSVFNADIIAPAVSISSPLNTATVRGVINVTASATDNQGVAAVQFIIDGVPVGAELTSSPYTTTVDTTGWANNSTHTIAASARDTSNNVGTSAASTVTASNPTPGAPAIDALVWADQPSNQPTATSPTFSTSFSNELLLAFVSTDYLGGTNTTVTGVTGGGLTWALVGRTNVQAGSSEVWRAFAPAPLGAVTVVATLSQAVDSSMTVVSFSNVDISGVNGAGAIGAIASANSLAGAPSATLVTTRDQSWVFGVGNDFDAAAARTVGPNQVLVHQYFPPVGDTYWVQRALAPTPLAGTSVTINDTAPTGDRYNLFIVEVKALNAPDTTAPTVAMTAPASGATVSGTAVTVSANAGDNIGVTSVQFKLDGVNLGAADTTSPYAVSWNSTTAANGGHTLLAVAVDGAGNSTSSAAVTVTVSNDTAAPTVAMTAPATGATVAGSVAVSANAADNVAVVGVQFKLDGANLGTEATTSPYAISWDTSLSANGSHTVTAVARDAAGNTTTAAAVTVTINNVDGTPPSVAMTAPANGATVAGGAVVLSATAADNIAVVGVRFLLDGATLGVEDTVSPYTISWNTIGVANGVHALSAVARDGAGNTTTSTPVSVTVNNDITAPAVAITAPATATTVGGTAVTVTASASDNVGVVGVQLLLDGAALGAELTAAPYTTAWNSTTTTNGSHTFAARARDAAGNQTTSAIVTVTVSNIATTPPVIDVVVSTDQPANQTTVTSPVFSTASPNELLLALVSTDYLSGANTTVTGITGGGLTWVLVGRSNVQLGSSEIWRAFAPSVLNNVSVVATLSQGVDSSMTVVSFSNVDTSGTNGSGAIGATAATNSASGAPTATLVTTRDKSYVFGVGNDFDTATARTVGANQTLVHQYFPPVGDTYWVQRTTSPIAAAATSVTINDTAPTSDRYNLFIAEIRASAAAPDTTAPSIALTSPADGATVSGSAVSVAATASDNIGVASVQFKLDGVNLGAADTTSPYSVTWNTTATANGSHTLTAVASDAAGNTTSATARTVAVDNDTQAPVTVLTAPAGGATVADSVNVSATASDNVAVVGVQFKLDGVNLGPEVTASPYSTTWDTTLTANGSHALTAVARDAAGNTATAAAVTVTVTNVDGTSPTVAITAPAGGATVAGAAVALSASAADNVAVVGVRFLLDGVNLGAEDTSSPYGITWSTIGVPNGGHLLTAIARDGAGNTTTSAAVSVTVNNDVTAPAVSITTPAAGATVSGTAVSLTASASDNIGVVGVQFLVDGVASGAEAVAAPYTLAWNSTTVPNGSHTIAARARDAAGNQTTSVGVTVTVSNAAATAPVIDAVKTINRSTNATTLVSGAFSTTSPNELLLAFIAADNRTANPNTSVTGITGAGLTWVLVQRTNVQRGTAEIWRAFAPTTLAGVSVTATLSQSVAASMTVVSFSNVDTTGTNGSGAIGAATSANSAGGAPSANLATTRNNSLVFGVGVDFDNAVARTIGPNQTMVNQYLATVGDTYWLQRTTNAVPAAGTIVTINDTAPTADRYNLTICEIRAPQ